MAYIKYCALVAISSFLVFYIGCAAMTATFNLSEMDKTIRETSFAFWVIVVVFACGVKAADDGIKNKS